MTRTFSILFALLIVAASAHAQGASSCQVRIIQERLNANPPTASEPFGHTTISNVVKTFADYPGTSSSTEVVKLDVTPWTAVNGRQEYVYAVNDAGDTWLPAVRNGIEGVGYVVKNNAWNGPMAAGPFNLVLQNFTEFRVAVVSRYLGYTVPVQIWLTTRVC